jgi:carbonic anhydrase
VPERKNAGVGRTLVRGLAAALLALAGTTATLATARAAGEPGVPWSYAGERGPDHWAELSPDYERCAEGQLQSPIDIRTARRIPYTPLVFQYRSQSLEAVNDGHGVRLLTPPGSELHVRGDAYVLTQVDFHVPGEHRVNGQAAAAEIHFVHRDAQGRHVIVAAPVRVGQRVNSTLRRIVDRLPLVPGERVLYRQVGVNPLFLLPSERDYYSYTGSLASPPCSESVLWFVLAHPLELDPEQIRGIARATGVNARPVQPLNDRAVFAALRH